ncbi:hypothetical protein MUN84_21690 [Hymenobacter sp. 5516J-16]|uniref:hypothetical protein n=1 Tax=Hymenobacter sp. 5516J-16 TaxID=2932253 RepID=UPI001FD46CE1|nr:hypothetical protein [Hymenobacter sp. 5516J-16]UOQ77038.1 hypothetical protein MUN84_21690 [Hymenobacter sp. 5516J-16]
MKKFVDDFIDFGPGRPYFPSNIHLEYYKPLKKQVDILREDMFQVSYGDDTLNYAIDVGWYGKSFSTIGFFQVYLIKNANWEESVLRIRCKSIKRLVPALRKCLERLKKDTDDFRLLPPIVLS